MGVQYRPTMRVLILILLILLILGGLPTWGWHNVGWGPSGFVTLLLIVVVVLFASDRL